MNLAEALLAADVGKIKSAATKDFEVKRLSGLFGAPFILHLKQIPNHRVREIQDNGTTIDKSGKPEVDTYKIYMGLVTDGIANPEFSNVEVLKKFGVATKGELFAVLFNAGEVQDIAQAVSSLNGFGAETVVEVKN